MRTTEKNKREKSTEYKRDDHFNCEDCSSMLSLFGDDKKGFVKIKV